MKWNTSPQFNTEASYFSIPTYTPTIQLTKGTKRDWLGRPIHPPMQQVSHTWWNFDDDTDFMIAQEAGTNEFQTLFPLNIRKKGRNPFTPPNGKVVTTKIQGPVCTEPLMKLVESTLLGPAAGMAETGRRLAACQMQIPTTGPNKEIDNSRITEVSDTLEIVYEGMHNLMELQKEPAPIDITITLTWVINQRGSGVYLRYKRQPYLRITISFDSKGKFGLIPVPEAKLWPEAYHKLLRYQLGCPARLEFGMDRDPAQCLTTFLLRAEVLVQTGTAPLTELQRLSFLLNQLLGRTDVATNQPLGFPISWLTDSSTMRTLQATARAGLPTANPPPAAVAQLPNTNSSAGYIDWSARLAETPPERLEDSPLGRYILDISRRRLLQVEIDRQAAASSLLDAPTNESEGDTIKDLEIDINDLDQQRSEYQRLQAEANKKPAAQTAKSNDDGDEKMPAKETKSGNKKPANDDYEDKKMPARTGTQIHPVSSAEATQWLHRHKAKVSIEDGSVYADCPIPPQVQQWLKELAMGFGYKLNSINTGLFSYTKES